MSKMKIIPIVYIRNTNKNFSKQNLFVSRHKLHKKLSLVKHKFKFFLEIFYSSQNTLYFCQHRSK